MRTGDFPMASALDNERSTLIFRACIAASILIHLLFFLWATHRGAFFGAPESPVEVDLTQSLGTLPFAGTGPAKLAAPKRLLPSKPGPKMPSEKPLPPKPVPLPPTPQHWVLPGPQTKTLVQEPKNPVEPITPGGAKNGAGTSPLKGGSGQGSNYGAPNGKGMGGGSLLALPKLLNLDEVLANLRKYYPEKERRAGQEGTVFVAIHIGVEGGVIGVDIEQSAGADFDKAASRVARLMRFSPAIGLDNKPVAVKIGQPMVFHLENSAP